MKRLANNLRRGVVFFFIILSIFLSCMRLNKVKDVNLHGNEMEKSLANHRDIVFPNQNFVHLKKYLLLDNMGMVCAESEKLSNCGQTEESVELYTSASGAVVDKDLYSVKILTAAHWCNTTEEDSDIVKGRDIGFGLGDENPKFFMTGDFYGKRESVEIIAIDLKNDLCLLKMNTQFAQKTKKLKLSKKEPKIGEKISIISAPDGLNGYKMRLHFEGQYAGCINDDSGENFCLFTIPGTYGTSGSVVLNKKREIVGIITVAFISFNHVTGGPGLYEIKNFLDQNL